MSLRTKCGLAQGSLACFLWPPLSHQRTKYIPPPSLWPPHWAYEWSGALAVMWTAHWGIPKGRSKITAWPDGTAAGQAESQALVHTKLSRGRWPPTGGASGSSLASAGILGKADGLQVVSRHSQVSPGHSGDALSSSPLPGLLLIPFLVSFCGTTFQTSRVPFVNSLPF